MVVSFSQKTASASVGAMLTSLIITPFDVVKVRLQSQICSTYPSVCTTFSGTLEGVFKIAQFEGISALWKGVGPTLFMAVPSQIVYLVGYDFIKDYVHNSRFGNSAFVPVVVGASARLVAASFISPIELIKTRVQSGKYGSTSTTIKNLFRVANKEGLSVFYRGLRPTLWRDVPFSAIYWGSYEYLKSLNETTASSSFLNGACSGIIAGTLTIPFDVAKTQAQTSNIRNMPLFSQFLLIYKDKGLKGFFVGLLPRIAKIAPSCAIMISSYEMGKIYFS